MGDFEVVIALTIDFRSRAARIHVAIGCVTAASSCQQGAKPCSPSQSMISRSCRVTGRSGFSFDRMPVLRNPKTNRFVQIDNAFLETNLLTWRAKGIFCYLLSRPDNWKFNLADLKNRSPLEGLDAIKTAMRELETMGYVAKHRVKSIAKGTWSGWEYLIRETPFPPRVDEPISGEPMSANPLCLSNTGLVSTRSCMENGDCLQMEMSRIPENEPSPMPGTEPLNPSKQPPGPKAKAPGRGMKSSACSKEQYVPKYSPDNKLPKRSSINWPSKEWFEQFSSEYGMMEDPDDLASVLHGLIKRDGKITNCESVLRGHYAERLRCALLNNQR